MAIEWNKTLSTSTTTTLSAADYPDQRMDLGVFFIASAPFWFFTGTWEASVTNHATPGTAGRGSLLPAGAYSWKLIDNETLSFRAESGSPTLEGAVTPL